jgi:hypothetical protein
MSVPAAHITDLDFPLGDGPNHRPTMPASDVIAPQPVLRAVQRSATVNLECVVVTTQPFTRPTAEFLEELTQLDHHAARTPAWRISVLAGCGGGAGVQRRCL